MANCALLSEIDDIEPCWAADGYRQCAKGILRRIGFIQCGKELGFVLKEIADLLALRVIPTVSCGDSKQGAVNKINDIVARVRSLIRMQQVLGKLALYCDSNSALDDCPNLKEQDSSKQTRE